MKICPKCELNYIADNADLCSVCAQQVKIQRIEVHDFTLDRSNDDEKFLRQIGAAWVVSYTWYNKVDKTHLNWRTVSLEWRISAFNHTQQYHANWLKQIIKMDECKLSKNHIGLSGYEIIAMARKLLQLAQ